MSQIENMVMQKTDYSIPDSMGILMTFKYDNVSLMDFQRIDELHDIGCLLYTSLILEKEKRKRINAIIKKHIHEKQGTIFVIPYIYN